jgi:hypothetical protein
MSDIPVPKRKPPVPFAFRPQGVTEQLKSFIKRHENKIPHFFKDTDNNMTIGYGLLVPDLNTARQLPLYRFSGENPVRPAMQQEIDEVWKKVRCLMDKIWKQKNIDLEI